MAQVAKHKLQDDPGFYGAKLATAKFYMQRLLPRVLGLEQAIRAGSQPLFDLSAEQF
ncbi:hypothetical protein D3C76_1879200 [compost metagenome]